LSIQQLREDGHGYKKIWKELAPQFGGSRNDYQTHCAELALETVLDDDDDDDSEAPTALRLPEVPAGTALVGASIKSPDGWIKVKADNATERVEIRQATPVNIQGPRPAPTMYVKGNWQNWLISPDAQIGYWVDSNGVWHTTHDEQCFDLGRAIGQAAGEDDGLHGWLDVGDFNDLAAPSRHNPTAMDLHVEGLNKTFQRGSEELAWRRWLVGEEGEVVLLLGNHDFRLSKKAAQDMPYLVGLKRPGDPDDEHPMLSVPYMLRTRDYGVEVIPSYPSVYRAINSNLVAFHAPAYGSRALDTARKIAARIHVSVVHGHIHRREHLAETIQTIKGARTLEVWSDGCWARIDGSLPGNESTIDDSGNRVIAAALPDNQGILEPNMQQGCSIVHAEVGGRERFSVERIAFWDGWTQWRGHTFEATCDIEGNSLLPEAA
jgi:hypothetical protein